MKIYTRTGDGGSTGLLTGDRVDKTHPRITLGGDLDELNCLLGVAASENPSAPVADQIRLVQHELFALGAEVSGAAGTFDPSATGRLERAIDGMDGELAPLRNFILPGGSPAAARLHLARAVCRRAERSAAALAAEAEVPPALSAYLNRLSDFLFVLARHENHLKGVVEPSWTAPSPPR